MSSSKPKYDYICPKCHEMQWETPKNMFDHIVTCKNDSDTITTKWYTEEELYNKYNSQTTTTRVIRPTVLPRPNTR